MNKYQSGGVIWGNENPPGPNLDEHKEDCDCWRCELKREE